MSDDTQHAQQESVHTPLSSAVPPTSITITIDTGERVSHLRFKVLPHHFQVNPDIISDDRLNLVSGHRIIFQVARQVNLQFTAENLIRNDEGHFLVWEHVND